MAEDRSRQPLLVFEGVARQEHFAEFIAAAMKRFARAGNSWPAGIVFLVGAFLATFALLELARRVARPLDKTYWLGPAEVVMIALALGFIGGLLLVWLMTRRINAAYRAGGLREGGSYLGRRRYVLDADGITVAGAHGTSTALWSAMTGYTEEPHTLLLWTDPAAAVIVPRDAFADAAAERAFKEFVADRVATRPSSMLH